MATAVWCLGKPCSDRNALKQTRIWSVGEWLNIMGPASVCHHIDSHTDRRGDGLVVVRGYLYNQVILGVKERNAKIKMSQLCHRNKIYAKPGQINVKRD